MWGLIPYATCPKNPSPPARAHKHTDSYAKNNEYGWHVVTRQAQFTNADR